MLTRDAEYTRLRQRSWEEISLFLGMFLGKSWRKKSSLGEVFRNYGTFCTSDHDSPDLKSYNEYEMELFGDMDGEKDGDFYDQPSENNSSKISPIS
jgi:hypothetical protein